MRDDLNHYLRKRLAGNLLNLRRFAAAMVAVNLAFVTGVMILASRGFPALVIVAIPAFLVLGGLALAIYAARISALWTSIIICLLCLLVQELVLLVACGVNGLPLEPSTFAIATLPWLPLGIVYCFAIPLVRRVRADQTALGER